MKKTIHSLIASSFLAGVLALGIVALPDVAGAQSSVQAEAKIPFAFQVGKVVLPAGDYLFSQQSTSMILVRNSKASAVAVVIPDSATHSRATSKIVFNRYGDRYFLHHMDVPNSNYAYKTLPGKQEKELARNLKLENTAQVVVTIGTSFGQ